MYVYILTCTSSVVARWISAPAWTSRSTTSVWPFLLATYTGLKPHCRESWVEILQMPMYNFYLPQYGNCESAYWNVSGNISRLETINYPEHYIQHEAKDRKLKGDVGMSPHEKRRGTKRCLYQKRSRQARDCGFKSHALVELVFLSYLSTSIPFLLTYVFIIILSAYQACEIGSELQRNHSEVIQ